MNKPELYRRRYIPEEIVHLKDDEITHIDHDVIVTKWNVLKPRKDFTHGVSCYFLNKGYKVSRFFNDDDECVCTYCDIVETEYDAAEDKYIFNDLLIDVVIYQNGLVKVMDLSEVPEALDKGLITIEQVKYALARTDELLKIIYGGGVGELVRYF